MQSDCFYNAGWTEDTRDVIDYLHREYANATLYAVGTSIGANILVCGLHSFNTCMFERYFLHFELISLILIKFG